MSVSVHYCRALRAIPHESFWGPYPGPLNKYLYTINCAFISVHHHRPSAWAAPPMQGGSNKPATKIWHPMWGLWLVVRNPEAHQHQAAACQPASSQPQSCTKIISFWWNNSIKCTTFQQQPTGWLWLCEIPLQSAVQLWPCAQGLCPFNIGGC